MKKMDIRLILKVFILFFFISHIYVHCKSLLLFSKKFDYYENATFYLYPLVAALLLHQVFIKLTLIELYFISFFIIWVCFLNVNPTATSQHNKIATLELIPEEFLPEIQCMLPELDIDNTELPIIIKPINCSGFGKGIAIIKERTDYDTFMSTVDNVDNFMVQNYLYNYNVEIGLMWERMPWNKTGSIIEVYEKTNTHEEIRSFEDGFIINRSHLINDELNKIFNDIGNKLPNLYACRYDIRLKNIDDLLEGKFKILEVNGTMGFSFYDIIEDKGNNLIEFINASLWYFRRIIIGLGNISLLQGYSPINLLLNIVHRYYSLIKCDNWEKMFEE